MKYLATVLFYIFSVASAAFGVNPAVQKAHAATLHIGQQVISGNMVCSATAIAPHAIITAAHCELPTDSLDIESVDAAVTIVGRIRDTYDHTILLLDGVTFKDYAEVKLADPLDQSEEVFIFGNPGKFSDIYRKGYVVGYERANALAASLGATASDVVLYNFASYAGDSGAAIFNEAGQVADILSFSEVFDAGGKAARYTGAFRIQFTEADIQRALKFVPAQK